MYKYMFVENREDTEREINETMENNEETDGEESYTSDRQEGYLDTARVISRDRQRDI